jgi:hypothetical protein
MEHDKMDTAIRWVVRVLIFSICLLGIVFFLSTAIAVVMIMIGSFCGEIPWY